MGMMSSFMDKLNEMELRISGLSSRVEATLLASASRKSRSHDKVKRVKLPDEEVTGKLSTSRPVVMLDNGTVYNHVLSDTAVIA